MLTSESLLVRGIGAFTLFVMILTVSMLEGVVYIGSVTPAVGVTPSLSGRGGGKYVGVGKEIVDDEESNSLFL